MSKKKVLKFLAPSLLAAALVPSAFAATTSGSLPVSLAVSKACSLSVTSSIDFGTQAPTASTTLQAGVTGGTTNGVLSVNCRKQNSSVTIQLTSGGGSGSSTGGNLSNVAGGGTTSNLAYNLYLPQSTGFNDAGLAQCSYAAPTAWPSAGLQFSTWASSGAKSIAVCSTTAIDQNTEAGTYTDTVNVLVTY